MNKIRIRRLSSINQVDVVVDEQKIEKCKNLYQISCKHNGPRQTIIDDLSLLYGKYKSLTDLYKKNGYVSDQLLTSITNESIQYFRKTFHNKELIKLFEEIRYVTFDKNKFKNTSRGDSSDNVIVDTLKTLTEGFIEYQNTQEETKKLTVYHRFNLLFDILFSLKNYGLHPSIEKRNLKLYILLIKHAHNSLKVDEHEFKSFITEEVLRNEYSKSFESRNFSLLINGKVIPIKKIKETIIISTILKEDEISLFCEKNGILYNGSKESMIQFIRFFKNEADEFLPKIITDEHPLETIIDAAEKLKDLLIVKPKMEKEERNREYKRLREILKTNEAIWQLTPSMVKDFHSYEEFKGYHKNWPDLIIHITTGFHPIFKYVDKIKRGEEINNPKQESTIDELSKVISEIEIALRRLINKTLCTSKGTDEFKCIIPTHLQNKINNRIQDYLKDHPGEDKTKFKILEHTLQFFDISEYRETIISNTYWKEFEPIFINKANTEKYFDQLSDLRNTIRHERELTDIIIANGHASIVWFKRAISIK